jgi:hypothetical protein
MELFVHQPTLAIQVELAILQLAFAFLPILLPMEALATMEISALTMTLALTEHVLEFKSIAVPQTNAT